MMENQIVLDTLQMIIKKRSYEKIAPFSAYRVRDLISEKDNWNNNDTLILFYAGVYNMANELEQNKDIESVFGETYYLSKYFDWHRAKALEFLIYACGGSKNHINSVLGPKQKSNPLRRAGELVLIINLFNILSEYTKRGKYGKQWFVERDSMNFLPNDRKVFMELSETDGKSILYTDLMRQRAWWAFVAGLSIGMVALYAITSF